MFPKLESCSHEERLGKIGLFSLEYKRMRANTTEMYKIETSRWRKEDAHLSFSSGLNNQGTQN